MSKRVIGLLGATVCVAALAVPTSANAVTRAAGEGVYAKTSTGYTAECRAVPIGAYIVSVQRCYVEQVGESARLCAQVQVRTIGIDHYEWWLSSLQCSDPTAPGAATAGALTFRG
jgi:hypothetical protein